MPIRKTTRKQLFNAALAIAGLTAKQWGEREGVTSGHLSMILADKRANDGIARKIDAFIRKHMTGHTALAG